MALSYKGTCQNCGNERQVKKKETGRLAGKVLCSSCWMGMGSRSSGGPSSGYRKQSPTARQHIGKGTSLAIQYRKGLISADSYGRQASALHKKWRHERYIKNKSKRKK